MIGIPAFMKTESCREKFITSFGGTRFAVISNLRMLVLGDTSSGW